MTSFWLGPFNIRVPSSCDYVVAIDGYNRLYEDGSQTEAVSMGRLTQEQYRERYAELRDDGYYWYVGTKEDPNKRTSLVDDGFWPGPYDIKIPNSITKITSTDEVNTINKDGTETNLPFQNRLSKQEYLNKYCENRNGEYWYKQVNEKFWLGPHGVRVPEKFGQCKAIDGHNNLFSFGAETEMVRGRPLSRDEYRNRFAELRPDGFYWYKGDN
jgi:hypothetical protein